MDQETNRQESIKVTNQTRSPIDAYVGVSQKDIELAKYISEKTSRIASVVLMLAKLLEDTSSLRTELERTSVGLIYDSASGARALGARESFVTRCAILIALLESASRAGRIAERNVEMIVEDLSKLLSFIGEFGWEAGGLFIDRARVSFDVPQALLAPEPQIQRSETAIRHTTDNVIRDGRDAKDTITRTNDVVERPKDISAPKQYRDRMQDVQKDRRATILGIVQRKDHITVKDVANVIKDCSEKTLQRELLALVAQGVLKKEGERRWSTYRFA